MPAVDVAPLSYPHGTFINKLYASIPYLEFGARQGRLTLLLDGRYSVKKNYYTDTALRGGNGYNGYYYSYSAWYVGFTLSYNLLHQL